MLLTLSLRNIIRRIPFDHLAPCPPPSPLPAQCPCEAKNSHALPFSFYWETDFIPKREVVSWARRKGCINLKVDFRRKHSFLEMICYSLRSRTFVGIVASPQSCQPAMRVFSRGIIRTSLVPSHRR